MSPPLSLSVTLLGEGNVSGHEECCSKSGDTGEHSIWMNVHCAKNTPIIILAVDVDAVMMVMAMEVTTMAVEQNNLITPSYSHVCYMTNSRELGE